jgi:hypothetical protein
MAFLANALPHDEPLPFAATYTAWGIELAGMGYRAWGNRAARKGLAKLAADRASMARTLPNLLPPTRGYIEEKFRQRGKGIRARHAYARSIGTTARHLGYVTLGVTFADMIRRGISSVGIERFKRTRERAGLSGAGYSEESYFDSRAAFTQRQRALQVIHNSQLSTRAAFGSEASFMHY